MENKNGEIIVCIGSQNPTKIRGIIEAFSKYYRVVDIRAKRVDTGMPPQPIGLHEIIEGARKRAVLSMDEKCDYGVGIEAGFVLINNEPFDVEAAYIVSKNGDYSIGFSPSFPIPKSMYKGIVNGVYRELEEAVEALFNVRGIGDREGFIGLLTKRVCDRWILSYYATLMALVKFINRELY